jgi:hypothetical protein
VLRVVISQTLVSITLIIILIVVIVVIFDSGVWLLWIDIGSSVNT